MRILLFLIIFIPVSLIAQLSYPPAKSVISKVYTQVIAEYITDVCKTDPHKFDTLFIGKHEDFPDLSLPKTIANKKIVLLKYVDGDTIPQNRRAFKFVNIIEWKITDTVWTYMLVTFHQGYRPQYNAFVDLKYNKEKKGFALAKKVRYEYPYPKK